MARRRYCRAVLSFGALAIWRPHAASPAAQAAQVAFYCDLWTMVGQLPMGSAVRDCGRDGSAFGAYGSSWNIGCLKGSDRLCPVGKTYMMSDLTVLVSTHDAASLLAQLLSYFEAE